MSPEGVLAEMVRDWAGRVLPGEPRIGDVAVRVAVEPYAGGGSISESCGRARSFVGSSALHPARRPVTAGVPIDLAS